MERKQLNQICSSTSSETVVTDYEPYYCRIDIGQGCGFSKSLKDGTKLQGIHVFYSTLIHEREHTIIKCENWDTEDIPNGVTKGYSTNWDMDGDGYKDAWEILHENDGFDLDQFDAYGYDINGNAVTYNSKLLGQSPPVYSAGTEYEEARCRDLEVASKGLHININQYDWSFDPSHINQGKQW